MKGRTFLLISIIVAGFIIAILLYVRYGKTTNETTTHTSTTNTQSAEQITVAFIGDQGYGKNAEAVLQLIKNEGADMVLHQGDFDYLDDPDAWDQQINNTLGASFPYFASIGNHDLPEWDSYQQKLINRLERIDGEICDGDIGVNAACTYQGIFFVLSGVGTLGENHDQYLNEQLAQSKALWKVCSWHKNQTLMQVEEKDDDTGWNVYETCRKNGALIMTGHAHIYTRTHLISSFEKQIVTDNKSPYQIGDGKTIAVVSGIAGKSIRHQKDELAENLWWASVYTLEQDAQYGALFCTFSTDKTANCYFKNIDEDIIDSFNLTTTQ